MENNRKSFVISAKIILEIIRKFMYNICEGKCTIFQ